MSDAAELWQNLVRTAKTDDYLYNLHITISSKAEINIRCKA